MLFLSHIDVTAYTQSCLLIRTSLVAQTVKRLPPMQETRVRSLGQEDPLEKEMATHSSTLAWRIPQTEEPAAAAAAAKSLQSCLTLCDP